MKFSARQRTTLRILWFGVLISVMVGSLLPGSSLPMRALSHVSDKLLHFAGYALLAFLPALHEDRSTMSAIAVGILALGVAMEFAQTLVGDRFFEIWDMVANWWGVFCGLLLGMPLRG